MNSIGYVWEKLFVAVDALTGAAPLRTRLHHAVMSFHTLVPDDFPTPDLVQRFSALMDGFRRTPARGDEGGFRASVDAMTDEEARATAHEIFSLFAAIAEHHRPLTRN